MTVEASNNSDHRGSILPLMGILNPPFWTFQTKRMNWCLYYKLRKTVRHCKTPLINTQKNQEWFFWKKIYSKCSQGTQKLWLIQTIVCMIIISDLQQLQVLWYENMALLFHKSLKILSCLQRYSYKIWPFCSIKHFLTWHNCHHFEYTIMYRPYKQ